MRREVRADADHPEHCRVLVTLGREHRLGQCSEMSPEGAKGYVTVIVRCGREAFVACFPKAQRS
jgi:hypothetical protein